MSHLFSFCTSLCNRTIIPCNRFVATAARAFNMMERTPRDHEIQDIGELSFNFTAILNLNTEPIDAGIANYLFSFFKQ